jgi:hypothetical protein
LLSGFSLWAEELSVVASDSGEKLWGFDLYAENYKTVVRSTPVTFDRWLVTRAQFVRPEGILHLGFEHYSTGVFENSQSRQSLQAVVGYKQSLSRYLNLSIGLLSHDLALKTDRGYSVRTGFTGGTIVFFESPSLFMESYYESFVQDMHTRAVPEKSFVTATAWGKLGWRLRKSELHPFIIDPLVAELRGHSNTETSLAGPSYAVLNLGPRLTYYQDDPNLFASLLLTKTHNLNRVSGQSVSDNWVLLSFGGGF